MTKKSNKSTSHATKHAKPEKKIKSIRETQWHKEKMKRAAETIARVGLPKGFE